MASSGRPAFSSRRPSTSRREKNWASVSAYDEKVAIASAQSSKSTLRAKPRRFWRERRDSTLWYDSERALKNCARTASISAGPPRDAATIASANMSRCMNILATSSRRRRDSPRCTAFEKSDEEESVTGPTGTSSSAGLGGCMPCEFDGGVDCALRGDVTFPMELKKSSSAPSNSKSKSPSFVCLPAVSSAGSPAATSVVAASSAGAIAGAGGGGATNFCSAADSSRFFPMKSSRAARVFSAVCMLWKHFQVMTSTGLLAVFSFASQNSA
mmetsp:Transcript_46768/g.117859  ORF Transcript_46768/g.117859 Transcript_46768/m.117859 type:complete len:270 (+) Transcript_46768:721-1530(+)